MHDSSELIWVLGYGKSGRRAVELIRAENHLKPSFTVIDQKPQDKFQEGIAYIQAEGIRWFTDHFHQTHRVSRIIPALPVHIAAQWIKRKLISEKGSVREMEIPRKILPNLPNPCRLSADTYAVSHADFICPSDCDEPEDFCTATGQPRPTPLYDLLAALTNDDVAVLTLPSRQFAAGVGGFYATDLWNLLDTVRDLTQNRFLLCTACKCHGIITGFELDDGVKIRI